MLSEILELLTPLTEEEEHLLASGRQIEKERYTSGEEFVIDSRNFLEKGRLIDVRKHTRFSAFPPHRHNYVEMVCVLSGHITTTVDETDRLELEEGDLLLLNRRAIHEILPCGAEDIAVNFLILPEFFSRPIIMLERENFLRDFLLASISEESSPYNYLLFHTKGILPVENLLENLLWNLLIQKHGMNVITQTTAELLFMNLAALSSQISHSEESRQRDLLFTAMEYINSHYRDGTLEELSSLTGYTPSHLSRLLKKRAGSNFKQMLQTRRLQQAIYYLENTILPTDRILTKIGYENSSYFYRIFREKYGCSPREYRQKHSIF